MEAQSLNLLAMVHLIMFSLWGGVVATEAVIVSVPGETLLTFLGVVRLVGSKARVGESPCGKVKKVSPGTDSYSGLGSVRVARLTLPSRQ